MRVLVHDRCTEKLRSNVFRTEMIQEVTHLRSISVHREYVDGYIYIYTHTYIHTYIYIHTHTYVYSHRITSILCTLVLYVCMYMYVYMNAYMRVRVSFPASSWSTYTHKYACVHLCIIHAQITQIPPFRFLGRCVHLYVTHAQITQIPPS